MTTEITSSQLIASAKYLNRRMGDLNAQVNTLRAQMLEVARELRAREQAKQKGRCAGRGAAPEATSPTTWHFGPQPSDGSADDGCQV